MTLILFYTLTHTFFTQSWNHFFRIRTLFITVFYTLIPCSQREAVMLLPSYEFIQIIDLIFALADHSGRFHLDGIGVTIF